MLQMPSKSEGITHRNTMHHAFHARKRQRATNKVWFGRTLGLLERVMGFGYGQRSVFENSVGDFPGGPEVKTPCFHGMGRGFDPWSGN